MEPGIAGYRYYYFNIFFMEKKWAISMKIFRCDFVQNDNRNQVFHLLRIYCIMQKSWKTLIKIAKHLLCGWYDVPWRYTAVRFRNPPYSGKQTDFTLK